MAEDNAELQDLLWDFKYGNGLVTSFHDVFDNMDYKEEEKEIETIINTELRNNLLLRVVGRCADFNASNVFLENDFASVKKDVPLIKSHETGRFIVSGANTKDRLAMNEHFVVQVPYMEFSGDNAEEHVRKYGYLVEEPKVSKVVERYRKGEGEPIEQTTNIFEEKTAKDYL